MNGQTQPALTSPTMLTNYLKIAWRNLVRNKVYSAINIIGLAVGLATCLLIVLFVLHELSYDRYHAKADRTFRITTLGLIGGKETNLAAIGAPAGPAFVHDYPGVEAATRVATFGTFIIRRGRMGFNETRVAFTDSNFFDTFSIPLLKGNSKKVLAEPNTVVITKTMARKYFGNQDPVGQTLTMGSMGLYRVTGVCQDVPLNTHFHYDFFAALQLNELGDKWLANGVKTYLVLRKGYPVRALIARNSEIINKYIAPEIKFFTGESLSEFLQKGNSFLLRYQPITDIHLHSHLEYEAEPNSDIKYIYIFMAIALFILTLACINFINLSTAGSSGRAKEVGIRKVLGSVQPQLIRQFLTESVLFTFLAILLSLGIVAGLLPGFNQLSGKQFNLSKLFDGWMLPGMALAFIGIGLLAGSYPAFLLSSFKPVSVLSGKLRDGARSSWLRSTLVITQFVVSIAMIIGTLIVYQQLHYIQNKQVGFDKEQVLILHDTYVLREKTQSFKAELAKLSSVRQVSLAGNLPAGASNGGVNGFQPDNGATQPETYRARTYNIDQDYLPTLGIRLALGRNFSQTFPSDSSAVLINETAAHEYNWTNPIGRKLSTIGNGGPGSKRTYTVVGVVKDFHFESLHHRVGPLVMFYGGDNYQMALRIQTSDMAAFLKQLEQRWKTQTDTPFSYSFLDERFDTIYQSEHRIGQLFGIFAGLAIFIACLGLFGLASFVVEQRTKEVGVRKVLGASVGSIVTILSKDFLKLVLISIVIASPIAWYAMNKWLEDFAYKIDIEWWVFALAGLLAMGIALLTVSFQAVKAALMNPVKSLRSE